MSTWTIGGNKKVRERKPRPTGYHCAYCGELGHNRQTCQSVDHAPVRLRDRVNALTYEKHPAEWERWAVARAALEFIAHRQRDPQARAVARLALKALEVP